jgi:hypothetical protein
MEGEEGCCIGPDSAGCVEYVLRAIAFVTPPPMGEPHVGDAGDSSGDAE